MLRYGARYLGYVLRTAEEGLLLAESEGAGETVHFVVEQRRVVVQGYIGVIRCLVYLVYAGRRGESQCLRQSNIDRLCHRRDSDHAGGAPDACQGRSARHPDIIQAFESCL